MKIIKEVGDKVDMAYALYQLGSAGEELGEFVAEILGETDNRDIVAPSV